MRIIHFIVYIFLLPGCLFFPLVAAEKSNTDPVVVPAGKPEPHSPLGLELKIIPEKIVYRQPVYCQLRFINRGDKPAEIDLNDSQGIVFGDGFLQWTLDGKMQLGSGFRNALHKSNFILEAKESLTIKMPPKLFFLGQHRVSAKFRDQENGGMIIESNVVAFDLKDEPMNRVDRLNANGKYRVLAEIIPSNKFAQEERYREIIQGNLLIGSPYSVHPLQQFLDKEQNVPSRLAAIQIFGLIADKERAARIGYIRDTSAADLVIERIDKESDAAVKTALLKIIGKFFDVLTPPQKEKLEKSVLVQLAHQDAGVRVQAALTLLELFPARRPAIETPLAKPEFADEAGRKQVTEALAKLLGK